MQTRLFALAAAIGVASGVAFAQSQSFNPLSATYGSCYVFRADGSYIWPEEEAFSVAGPLPLFMNRSVTMPPNPSGGYAAQFGTLAANEFTVTVVNQTWWRASVSCSMWVRFRPNVSQVDVRIRGQFGVVNYMDSNRARLVDRTWLVAVVDESNFTKDEVRRVTLDPTHDYELYVATNHNNIFQGPTVADHVLISKLSIAPAQNWLNGSLSLAQVASPTASDRIVTWQVVQNGLTLSSGTFPNMGVQQFRLGVPVTATGPAHVVFDTDTFLRRVVPVTLGSSEITLDPTTLLNGDVDGSNEVDLTDIDLVIGKYLESGWALPEDVDLSGEVDLTDIDVVISNYLTAGDELP